VQLANQNVLQQHVDHHITSALLKKGTQDAYNTFNQQDRAWVDMRLHESQDEGGFGIPNNTITRCAAAYTTNARDRYLHEPLRLVIFSHKKGRHQFSRTTPVNVRC
jgi:hypothetical protein